MKFYSQSDHPGEHFWQRWFCVECRCRLRITQQGRVMLCWIGPNHVGPLLGFDRLGQTKLNPHFSIINYHVVFYSCSRSVINFDYFKFSRKILYLTNLVNFELLFCFVFFVFCFVLLFFF